MAEHTPGPWVIDHTLCGEKVPIRARWNGGQITVAYAGNGYRMLLPKRKREVEANARLIAAAPDLLAAAEMFVAWDTDEGRRTPAEMRDLLQRAAYRLRYAVAKAKGENS
jgi:hypothetical protein